MRSLILCILLILTLTGTASAQSDIAVRLNGQALQFDEAPPIIRGGRTLVPIRAIAEALGAKIEWMPESSTIAIVRGDKALALGIGGKTAVAATVYDTSVGGKQTLALDVPATIVNGRTLVPLRFVAEAFSAEVSWNTESRTIEISAPGVESAQGTPRGWWLFLSELRPSATTDQQPKTPNKPKPLTTESVSTLTNKRGSAVIVAGDRYSTSIIDLEITTFTPTDPDHVWVFVMVGIKNTGKRQLWVSPGDFTLATPEGVAYKVDYFVQDDWPNNLDRITLPSGTSTAGWVIFSAPRRSTYTLHWDSFSESAAVKIDVAPRVQ